ncbi:hypothetical protein Agabi119p4_3281 [Agaricus bisporus var. burnettii]|uniref:Uncharacterized protein n=1 Tax=Agaricus bisporus var. burnettii TaxID=192524 RepID=A0A8H7F6W2_AGABI|nr:hypothetical protein Agabi119p4_3281 [Agaricus bisporus var. burnettii]
MHLLPEPNFDDILCVLCKLDFAAPLLLHLCLLSTPASHSKPKSINIGLKQKQDEISRALVLARQSHMSPQKMHHLLA